MKFLFFFMLFVAIYTINAKHVSSSESHSNERDSKHMTKEWKRGGMHLEHTGDRDKDYLKPIMSYPMRKKNNKDSDSDEWKDGRRVGDSGHHRSGERHNGRKSSESDEHRRVSGYDHKTNQVYRAAQNDNKWMHVEEKNRKPMESHRGKHRSSESHGSSEERRRTHRKDSRENSKERRGGHRGSHESGKHH